eukprot:scaffold9673_cov21-Tisochrysis_lutea.AAC.2
MAPARRSTPTPQRTLPRPLLWPMASRQRESGGWRTPVCCLSTRRCRKDPRKRRRGNDAQPPRARPNRKPGARVWRRRKGRLASRGLRASQQTRWNRRARSSGAREAQRARRSPETSSRIVAASACTLAKAIRSAQNCGVTVSVNLAASGSARSASASISLRSAASAALRCGAGGRLGSISMQTPSPTATRAASACASCSCSLPAVGITRRNCAPSAGFWGQSCRMTADLCAETSGATWSEGASSRAHEGGRSGRTQETRESTAA